MIPAVLVSVIIFMGLIFALGSLDKQSTVNDRVRKLADDLPEEGAPSTESLTRDDTLTPTATMMNGLLSAIGVDVEKYKETNGIKLHQAGMLSASAPVYYLFCKYILSIILILLAALVIFSPAQGMHRILNVVLGLILAVGALKGPDIYVTNITQKRQQVLQRSFPDMLDLLLVCVESGLALDGALSRVCRELGRAHPEITKELNHTRMELTLLNDRGQALQNLAERTGLLPFRSLVGSLLQSERFGTNLTETLRVLAEDYRNERMMIAENKAGRLPVLMTIPLLLLMLPALFMLILGPAIIGVMAVFSDKH